MNNIAKALINPFDRIAGWKSFFIGIAIVVATVVVGWQSSICFRGALDAKTVYELDFDWALYCQFISLAALVGVFYLAALLFARGTRFQDILGTITFSRFPYLFIALLGFLSTDAELAEMNQVVSSGNVSELLSYLTTNIKQILLPILMIPFLIWSIVLLYNAFRVSTGLKGAKCGVVFTTSLILAEIISLIFIFLMK
ncbi:YIP1 family protein [Dysgonomonas massiliensis]|uniref:YIP1 family protein n=1 Tax=Dysgonomonas massiliensis TaxID=2040292 RepID=UPI000C773B9B|nr:YIP1 family protein [Dysgonomonas massiliensis]